LDVLQWLTSDEIQITSWESIDHLKSSSTNDLTKPFDWCSKQIKTKHINEPRLKYLIDLPQRDPSINHIKVRNNLGRSAKAYAISLAKGTDDAPFCTDPNLPVNLITGFLKRIAPVMPEVNPEKLSQLSAMVIKWLNKRMIPLRYQPLSLDNLNLWLLTTRYNEKRRQQIRDAFSRCVISDIYCVLLTEWDFRCKSFIKREFYEVAKFLRLINSRMDSFKSFVAPYIHKIESIFFKNRHFVKHITQEELPHKISKLKVFKYFIQLDYSSFESGFSSEYTDAVECNLWRHMLKNNPVILGLVMKCYYQVRGGIKIPRIEKLRNKYYSASVSGTRMSGEMWTSLANSFSNYMNFRFICKTKNILWDGYFEGDDAICGMDSDALVESDFTDLGFRIKFKIDNNLEDTSFCGSYFNILEEKLIQPPEQIARLCWTHSVRYLYAKRDTLNQLLRMKAMSGFCLGKHTPIFGPMCRQILKIINIDGKIRCEDSNIYWEQLMLDEIEHYKFDIECEITMSSRLFYATKFNIPINLQLIIEDQIKRWETLEDVYIPYQFLPGSMLNGVRMN